MLITSSISAALAVAQVGKGGNSSAGWLPVCRQVPKYCDQVTGALAAGFIGVLIYLLLLLYSIHTVLNPLLVQKTWYVSFSQLCFFCSPSFRILISFSFHDVSFNMIEWMVCRFSIFDKSALLTASQILMKLIN